MGVDVESAHLKKCVALAGLIGQHSDVLRLAIEYFENNPAPWINLDTEDKAPSAKKSKKAEKMDGELELVESCLKFLLLDQNYFCNVWQWSSFFQKYLNHTFPKIRWLACQCFGIVMHLSESQRSTLVPKYLSTEDANYCSIVYSDKLLNLDENDSPELNKISAEISQLSVKVCGISLPAFVEPSSDVKDSLILVNSTASNVRNLALAVAANKTVCLSGPVGCGKTSAVQYLAQVTGREKEGKLLKVQLGEETDSKMLLGSYKCTDIPGEFIWQPGVLTKAVTEGKWLLLEDIDAAGSDVASVLVSLIENKYLSVPGFRDNITPHLGFHLFLTQRSILTAYGEHSIRTNTIELLEKQWLKIKFEPLTKQELISLIQTKFPTLTTFSNKMVAAFLLFSVGNHIIKESDINDIIKSTGRLASTRDLMKWCARAVAHYNLSSNESALQIYQDALDLFCCSVVSNATRIKLACAVASCLGIIQTKAEFYFNSHKPSINLAPTRLEAGRTLLKRQFSEESPAMMETNQLKSFAFTRISSCLIERIACCLSFNEPVLLVGETGTGKTASLQLLAKHTGNQLVVLNLNQQSDSADLLGGYKPVDLKFIIAPIRDEFEALFRKYFKVEPNIKFLQHISNCFNNRNWKNLVKLMSHSCKTALKRLEAVENEEKTEWKHMSNKIEKLLVQVNHGQPTLAFYFIEGTLVRALRNGYWVLLDEINLATAETLQCLSGLLEDGGTLSLLEKDDAAPIQKHPNFRIMAAMNPATDVGKKDLPPGIRNRFTELFVDELSDIIDLMKMVVCYLKNITPVKCENIAKFYLKVKKEAAKSLTDGVGQKPHYSLRTLCRALSIAAANPCNNIKKSLYEAFCLSFLTQLDSNSHKSVQSMILKMIVGQADSNSVLTQPIPEPSLNGPYVNFEGYWVQTGSLEPKINDKYILTPTVRSNLRDLVRVVSLANHPVLLQGDTSIGKTSLITYLASASGNKCLRINNHEHTDLQEYIGSYCADAKTGLLVFQEGVLVEAMRHGHWIILDELNLAPTDVLEALNRVLDDNRELYIPETQEIVKANSKFRLFATQNPPGSYGGRKVMSRAFRNRFIEFHFGEIPPSELETILHQRCDMPLSYCKKIIYVMRDLQAHRRGSAAFSGKSGFITLRDLFRWGERYRLASGNVGSRFYDWDQHIADEGYLVLAGRVRKFEERDIIRNSIEKHIKRTVDPSTLFNLSDKTSTVTKHILEKYLSHSAKGFDHLVWTHNMRQMIVLIGKAMEFKEPLLLVGETGCGKTSVCQVIASCNRQQLFIVNCHQHSESSDFLGGLRPVRDHSSDSGETDVKRLFEWVDGPLIKAMNSGEMFLADEISLADDSVLERLNSLLEPERKILVSEKMGLQEMEEVTADEDFHFIGTMNPGGDYGKKELSPALRNRLTEIWCESCSEEDDLLQIIEHNIRSQVYIASQGGTSGLGRCMLDFFSWLQTNNIGKRLTISIRDILTWVNFINLTTNPELMRTPLEASCSYVHGACLTLLDSLGSGLTGIDNTAAIKEFRESAVSYIINQISPYMVAEKLSELHSSILSKTIESNDVFNSDEYFGIPPFLIKKGEILTNSDEKYSFSAGTTHLNLVRLLRALQIPNRAILLEGSPGVGKTTLVQALAQASGHALVRINLSEQTDVSDLFGADLPVDGGEGGQFQWRDGPFLKALKDGVWILLDELNLASQSVLEGLNAVLDHRGELFIPELGKTFNVALGQTRLFACQNPLSQGGARRGLPRSFLNRFTQVFMEPLTDSDLNSICLSLYPSTIPSLLQKMIDFNSRLAAECGIKWAFRGAPWEMNLRDLSRWLNVMYTYSSNSENLCPGKYVSLLYADRMRTSSDKQKVLNLYENMFGEEFPLLKDTPRLVITQEKVQFDDVALNRCEVSEDTVDDNVVESGIVASVIGSDSDLLILRDQINILRSLTICIKMNWMPILIGDSGSGKSSVVKVLAQLCSRELHVLSVNSAMDTMEILGGFEQADFGRHLDNISTQVERLVLKHSQMSIIKDKVLPEELLVLWEKFKKMSHNDHLSVNTLASETALFSERLKILNSVLDHLKEVFPKRTSIICKLISQLKGLEANVKKTGSLNAGGKFEWVDSVLVKCLRDGSWLLIDNVNLCSPAVLDRLNGLLEPNGVLTIGERGVDNDGAVPVIKPHPQFRLFLAMNPQYGEISRAMRNRGVELSLISDENHETNELDLSALLEKTGIKKFEHRHCLLTIYNTMKQLSIGFDVLSVSHLLHVAFLVVQYWKRGFSFLVSLENSCLEVYIKSRTLNFEQKEAAKTAFIQSLRTCKLYLEEKNMYTVNQDSCRKSLRNLFKQSSSTLSTLALQNNSKLAVVKCQISLLETLMRSLPDLAASQEDPMLYELKLDINVFLKIIYSQGSESSDPKYYLKITNIIMKLVLAVFNSATADDFSLRHFVLQNAIDSLSKGDGRIKEYFNLVTEICKNLSSVLARSKNWSFECSEMEVNCNAFPIDGRRYLLNLQEKSDQTWSNENKLFVLMNLILVKVGEKFLKDSVDSNLAGQKWKEMTVALFSYAFAQGCVTNISVSETIIEKFYEFVCRLDEIIESVLSAAEVELSTSSADKLCAVLHWRHRFVRLGSLKLFSEQTSDKLKSQASDDVMQLLTVHFKWIMKNLIPHLLDLLVTSPSLSNLPSTKEFFALLETIDASLNYVAPPLLTVMNELRKKTSEPLPIANEKEAEVLPILEKVNEFTSVWPTDPNIDIQISKLKHKMSLLGTPDWKRLHKVAVTAFQSVLEDDLDKAKLFSKEAVKLYEVLNPEPTEDGSDDKSCEKSTSNVQMWPVQEFFALKLNKLCQIHLVSSEAEIPEPQDVIRTLTNDDVASLAASFRLLPSVPAEVTGLLSSAVCSNKAPNFKLKVLNSLLEHSRFSPAVYNYKFWLNWNTKKARTEDNVENIFMDTVDDSNSINNLELSPVCPSLSVFVTEIVLSDLSERNYSIIASASLKDFSNKVMMLNQLTSILWQNKMVLSHDLFDNCKNDEVLLKQSSHYFVLQLQASLNPNQIESEVSRSSELFSESVNSCVKKLEEFSGKMSSVLSTYKQKNLAFSVREMKNNDDSITDLKNCLKQLSSCVSNLENSVGDEKWLLISKSWINFGLTQLLAYTYLESVDPVEKNSLKYKYATEEFEDINDTLLAEELQSKIQGTSNQFPFLLQFSERASFLTDRKTVLKQNIALRPQPPLYNILSKELRHFLSTLGLHKNVSKLSERMVDCHLKLAQNKGDLCLLKEARQLLKEHRSWQTSTQRFYNHLTKNYGCWYRDIVTPILYALNQMMHGMSILSSLLNKSFLRAELVLKQSKTVISTKIDSLLSGLAKFPQHSIKEALNVANICTSRSTLLLLNEAVKSLDSNQQLNVTFSLIRCSLQEIYLVANTQGNLKCEKLWEEMNQILAHLVNVWQKQEEEKKHKEEEEESLYKVKTCAKTLSDEEEAALEMAQLFASYDEVDFNDFSTSAVLDSSERPKPFQLDAVNVSTKLTDECVKEICQLHSKLMTQFTRTSWMSAFNLKPGISETDFMEPFIDRINIFSILFSHYHQSLDYSFDRELLPSLLFLTYSAKNIITNNALNKRNYIKTYNFYHDSNITEVKECIPVLNAVKERVNQLLAEWPEHPTLNSIIQIINRVLNFSASSPVARFLTGFEMLLNKTHEWEEVAHSGVSLMNESQEVTAQIFKWRKLELKCWKNSLSNVSEKIKSGTSKWWFHLYSLTSAYINPTDPNVPEVEYKDFVETAQKFIESATLGDFEPRLDLIHVFHCHTSNLPSSKKQSDVCNIFWNLYSFYSQFLPEVRARIKDLSAPVQKELSDFIKIARWNDTNYWTVKETVKKTHRFLHRCIKKYQVVLQESVTTAMVHLEESSKTKETPAQILEMNISNFVSVLQHHEPEFFQKMLHDQFPKSNEILQSNVLKKISKISKQTFLSTSYPTLTQILDNLTTVVIESAEELRALEVDMNLTKEKQKSQAKSIHQQKRKALVDLFKALQKIGLSYQAGLVMFGDQVNVPLEFTHGAPFNVANSLQNLKTRCADHDLLAVWDGCERHFLRSVAKHAQLRKAFGSAHKSMNTPYFRDRLKGFPNHLVNLTMEQRQNVTKSFNSLCQLRCFVSLISGMSEDKSTVLQEKLLEQKDDYDAILDDAIYYLQGFKVFMNVCPESQQLFNENQDETLSIKLKNLEEPLMAQVSKDDLLWQKVEHLIDSLLKQLKEVKNELNRSLVPPYFNESFSFISNETKNIMTKHLRTMSDVQRGITEVHKLFSLENFDSPVAAGVVVLKEKITVFMRKHSDECRNISLDNSTDEDGVSECFKIKLGKLAHKLLFIIQELYKKFCVFDEESVVDTEITEENDELMDFKKQHLTKEIMFSLNNDVDLMELKTVNGTIGSLLKQLVSIYDSVEAGICRKMLIGCLPLLDQLSLTAQFIVTQQVKALRVSSKLSSILMSLFLELVQKGFCIPDDLLEEEGEGEGGTSGGLGLGDGKGEKDVSEEIESQDQLEDAKKPGEKEEENDEDCKEEEKGIDMSDDFGGKLQDIEQKENEDDSDQSDNGDDEEPDKEMGETEEGAETLDEKVWGSDSEGEEEDEEESGDKELNEEEGDKGEQVGEKELGAKDDSREDQPNENDEKDQNDMDDKRKEINDIDENGEENDDQVDPYHGKDEPQPEPEAFDLPDNLQLDDGDINDKDNDDEENPFDIDAMKQPNLPEEEEEKDQEPNEDENEAEKLEDNENMSEEEGDDENEEGTKGDDEPNNENDCNEEEEKENETEDGGKMDDDKSGEEPKSNEDVPESEKAKPSEDDASADPAQQAEQVGGSTDQVEAEKDKEKKKEKTNSNEENQGADQQGVGDAKQETTDGHSGAQEEGAQSKKKGEKDKKRKQKPGKSDINRTLADLKQPMKKRLKTTDDSMDDKNPEKNENDEDGEENENAADLYQHVKSAEEKASEAQTLDAATEEQAEKQPVPDSENDQNSDVESLAEDDKMDLDEDEDMDVEKVGEIKPEETKSNKKTSNNKVNNKVDDPDEDLINTEAGIEIEGEAIQTMTVEREPESSHHTQQEVLDAELEPEIWDIATIRDQIENQLASWSQTPSNDEASKAWQLLTAATHSLSQELSEQLRLVLEPCQATRLKGDFRTGRRINMRKVIPYIASQFRKDKIWLRRTKPSKRDYQIIMAVDDSSSMSDNHSKELAFESLATISRALSLLEAGELGVVKFGEESGTLHPLGESFSEHSGARLLQQFSFEQKKTRVGELVEYCIATFAARQLPRSAQLLIILSDGRGILSEGQNVVKTAVRRARLAGIFIVFLIIDNPASGSVLDISMPLFNGNQLIGMSSYMDNFPFPFYLLLRDVNNLPSVLSDALRQWFELVTDKQ